MDTRRVQQRPPPQAHLTGAWPLKAAALSSYSQLRAPAFGGQASVKWASGGGCCYTRCARPVRACWTACGLAAAGAESVCLLCPRACGQEAMLPDWTQEARATSTFSEALPVSSEISLLTCRGATSLHPRSLPCPSSLPLARDWVGQLMHLHPVHAAQLRERQLAKLHLPYLQAPVLQPPSERPTTHSLHT